MCWYTIMAPPEVLEQITQVWPTLEAKTSWSLRRSLSDRPAYTTRPQQTTVTSHSVPTLQPNQPDAAATPNVPATDSAFSLATQIEQITTSHPISKPNYPIMPKPLWLPQWILPPQPLNNQLHPIPSVLDVPTWLWSLLSHKHTLSLLLLPLTLNSCRTPTTRATGAPYSTPH